MLTETLYICPNALQSDHEQDYLQLKLITRCIDVWRKTSCPHNGRGTSKDLGQMNCKDLHSVHQHYDCDTSRCKSNAVSLPCPIQMNGIVPRRFRRLSACKHTSWQQDPARGHLHGPLVVREGVEVRSVSFADHEIVPARVEEDVDAMLDGIHGVKDVFARRLAHIKSASDRTL